MLEVFVSADAQHGVQSLAIDAEQLRRPRHDSARLPQRPLDDGGLEAAHRFVEAKALPLGRCGQDTD